MLQVTTFGVLWLLQGHYFSDLKNHEIFIAAYTFRGDVYFDDSRV